MATGDQQQMSGWPTSTVISGLLLVVTAAGAGWTIIQQEVSSIYRQIEANQHANETRDNEIHAELTRREQEIKAAIAEINHELDLRRSQFVEQVQYNATEKSVDEQFQILRERLLVLEQTRPTTGELKNIAEGTTARIDRLHQMVQSLEEWIRTRQSSATPLK